MSNSMSQAIAQALKGSGLTAKTFRDAGFTASNLEPEPKADKDRDRDEIAQAFRDKGLVE